MFPDGQGRGVSNLGGSLLSVYAASVGGNKQDMRYIVAWYYLVFGAFQISTLVVTGRMDFSYNLLTPVISVAVYALLGRTVFRKTPETAYKPLFAAFMAAYGTALLIS